MGLKRRHVEPQWEMLEKQFFHNAQKTLRKLEKRHRKEVKITFSASSKSGYVYIQVGEDYYSGKSGESFELSTISSMLAGPAHRAKVRKHLAKAILELKKQNYFAPFVEGWLSVYLNVDNRSENGKLICTVDEKNKSGDVFAQKGWAPTLSAPKKANQQWWFAYGEKQGTAEFLDHFETIEKKIGQKLTPYGMSWKHMPVPALIFEITRTDKMNDWMYGLAPFTPMFFSYRLCALLKTLGVDNIEYYPVRANHADFQQTSNTYFQFAVIPNKNDFVFATTKGQKQAGRREYHSYFDREEHDLYARVSALRKTKSKVFVTQLTDENGMVVSDEVKQACEASGLTGIHFHAIKNWDIDELAVYQKNAKNGDMLATVHLGCLYLEGVLVKKSIPKAVILLETVVLSDDVPAKEHLFDYIDNAAGKDTYKGGWRDYLLGLSAQQRNDFHSAKSHYEDSCKAGYKKAKNRLKEVVQIPDSQVPRNNNRFWGNMTLRKFEKLYASGADLSDVFEAMTYELKNKDVFARLIELYPACLTKKNKWDQDLLSLCADKYDFVKILIDAGLSVKEVSLKAEGGPFYRQHVGKRIMNFLKKHGAIE